MAVPLHVTSTPENWQSAFVSGASASLLHLPDPCWNLTEISTQIEAAVVLDREGTVVAATVDDERAGRMAGAALELYRAADGQREQELVQLDAALDGGSVFVVRDADRLIAAITRIAASESPPRSKNDSSTPTCSSPSTWA